MKARRSGTIINISSIAGRKTFPNHAAYCATKFAVHALTENIREEVADVGVRMVTIAPGAVETELLSHTTDESIKAGYHDWKDQMGGVIAPEVIADAVLYAWHQPANVCVRGDRAGGHPSATLMQTGRLTLPWAKGYHRPSFVNESSHGPDPSPTRSRPPLAPLWSLVLVLMSLAAVRPPISVP